MGVEYREIAGSPGYRLGSDGSVWSSWSRYSDWKLLTHTLPRRQRRAVAIGGRYFNVDRLVLETFRGPPPEPTMDAVHLDGDTWNDRLENLAWGVPAVKPPRAKVGTTFAIPDDAYARLPGPVLALFPENRFSFTHLVTSNSFKHRIGIERGWVTACIYMAPSTTLGLINTCGSESDYCRASCLGRGKQLGQAYAHRALVSRALFWLFHKEAFRAQVVKELRSVRSHAVKRRLNWCMRLNGTSDIAYEADTEGRFLQDLVRRFPGVPIYDYTKHLGRCFPKYQQHNGIAGYHLTFSHSGTNWQHCQRALSLGVNVAVVFEPPLPRVWQGRRVIDGDEHDLRFLDPDGVIVGLKEKKAFRQPGVVGAGMVDRDASGPFVIRDHLRSRRCEKARPAGDAAHGAEGQLLIASATRSE